VGRGLCLLILLTWICLLSLQESLFDTHANPGLAILGFFICFAISTILWILAAFFLFILFWVTGLAIGWALRVPSYLRNSCTNFWQKWTLAPRRFRWRSLRGFSDSKTPLISEVGCSHDCQTTSKLCQECYHFIQRSRLISGSFCLFTRRVEWYKWVVPVQGSDFRTSRRSCQLCHVLWYSLDEQERLKLAGPYTAQRQLPDACRWLWLSVRKEQSGRFYISLSDGDASRPEDRRNLCEALEIREGLFSPSDSRSWNAYFFRTTERSSSIYTYSFLDW
jgi:hypothetical protein